MKLSSVAGVKDRLVAALYGFNHPKQVRENISNPEMIVETKGWVSAVLRERGKIVPGSRREGHNVWTTTGREYLALMIGYKAPGSPNTTWREDRIAYIGVGSGAQTPDVGVQGLITPLAYLGTTFLAPLDLINGVSPSFPLTTGTTAVRTTIEYHRLFAEDEITLTVGSSVTVSEFGLFTDGEETSWTTGAVGPTGPGRDTSFANAALQSPQAYWSVEPFVKTDDLALDVSWQIRFG